MPKPNGRCSTSEFYSYYILKFYYFIFFTSFEFPNQMLHQLYSIEFSVCLFFVLQWMSVRSNVVLDTVDLYKDKIRSIFCVPLKKASQDCYNMRVEWMFVFGKTLPLFYRVMFLVITCSKISGLHPGPHHSRVLALPAPDHIHGHLQWVPSQATLLSTAPSAEAALGKTAQFTSISWLVMLICCFDFQNINFCCECLLLLIALFSIF